MTTIWQKVFWKSLFTKVVKTIAQTAAAVLVAGPVANMFHAEWLDIVGVSLFAGIACALMNIGSSDDPMTR